MRHSFIREQQKRNREDRNDMIADQRRTRAERKEDKEEKKKQKKEADKISKEKKDALKTHHNTPISWFILLFIYQLLVKGKVPIS